VSRSSEFCRHNPLCCFSTSVCCCCCCWFRYRLSQETFGYILVYYNVWQKQEYLHITLRLWINTVINDSKNLQVRRYIAQLQALITFMYVAFSEPMKTEQFTRSDKQKLISWRRIRYMHT